MTHEELEEIKKSARVREALKQLSFMDIQMMWTLVEALWRAKILVSRTFYDLDETLRWETFSRQEDEEYSIHPWCRKWPWDAEDWFSVYQDDTDECRRPKKKQHKVKGETLGKKKK